MEMHYILLFDTIILRRKNQMKGQPDQDSKSGAENQQIMTIF
jgi:hypothetical protein